MVDVAGRFSAKRDTGQWSIISDDGLVLNTDIAPWQGWATADRFCIAEPDGQRQSDDNRHVQAETAPENSAFHSDIERTGCPPAVCAVTSWLRSGRYRPSGPCKRSAG